MQIKHSDGRVETWSREDLEGVDWTFLEAVADFREGETETVGPAIFDSHLGYALARLTNKGEEASCGDLMAAAPELALACLEARTALLEIGLDDEPGTCEDLIRALDAALALAGVQP